jgi:hypothetical protein
MREEPDAAIGAGSGRKNGERSGPDLARRYPIALALYVVLAALSWFTLDGTIIVSGKPVQLRLVPLIIICALALRTMLAMRAEKIRREED